GVSVIAVDQRRDDIDAPVPVEVIVERRHPVAVDGLNLFGLLGNLTEIDSGRPLLGLVEIDELEAQIDPAAGLGPQPLRSPSRTDRAERAAAAGVASGWNERGRERKNDRADAAAHHVFPL